MLRTDISDVLQHVGISCNTNEQLELAICRPAPEEDDQARQNHSAHRIQPPDEFRAANTRENTESVDGKVVAMVFPQNAHLAVFVTNRPAVQEQAELCCKRNGHGNNGWQVEVVGLRAFVFGNFADGLDNDDDRDGDHQGAETQVPGCFDARFAAWEFAPINSSNGAIAQDQREVGQWVEEGVGHGSEQGQRFGADGGVELQDGEDDVGNKGTNDGDFVLEVVRIALFFCSAAVVIDGLEEALNVLVLGLVEFLELLCIARLAIQSNGTAAIALSRRVGSDQRHFTLWLDGGGEVVWIVVLWRGLALEVVAAVFAGTVRDMSVGHRLMVAGCACGFNGGAVAICFTNCGFGCG
jgi:hypothetical protein